MELGVKLASIFFSMILVNNYVLVKFLGICPFLGVSKKLDSAVGMSCAVIFVMVLATLVTFPIQIFLLDANDLGYLQTIVFILIIAVLVQLIEIILKKYMPPLYNSLGVYLPLITTNCCVLGVTVLNVDNYAADVVKYGFGFAYAESLICAAGAACASALRQPIAPSASRACPSPWCLPPLPACPSWASAASSRTSLACKEGRLK